MTLQDVLPFFKVRVDLDPNKHLFRVPYYDFRI